LKNILAIGVGIVEGLGFGINTSAALITLGAREIQLFAKIHQANPTTLLGLPGIGKGSIFDSKF
jgi:glycerol-3-phosphate dehydrogenase (NAD(P)+)